MVNGFDMGKYMDNLLTEYRDRDVEHYDPTRLQRQNDLSQYRGQELGRQEDILGRTYNRNKNILGSAYGLMNAGAVQKGVQPQAAARPYIRQEERLGSGLRDVSDKRIAGARRDEERISNFVDEAQKYTMGQEQTDYKRDQAAKDRQFQREKFDFRKNQAEKDRQFQRDKFQYKKHQDQQAMELRQQQFERGNVTATDFVTKTPDGQIRPVFKKYDPQSQTIKYYYSNNGQTTEVTDLATMSSMDDPAGRETVGVDSQNRTVYKTSGGDYVYDSGEPVPGEELGTLTGIGERGDQAGKVKYNFSDPFRIEGYDRAVRTRDNKATGQTEVIDARTGQPVPPDVANKALEKVASGDDDLNTTEQKQKQFYDRMLEAEQNIQALEGDYDPTGIGSRVGEEVYKGLPWGMGGTVTGEQTEKYSQAKDQFIAGVLRQESGASISDEEYNRMERVFFPQPGDSPSTVEQKKKARRRAIETMKIGKDPMKFIQPGSQQQSQQQSTGRPAGVPRDARKGFHKGEPMWIWKNAQGKTVGVPRNE